MRGGATPGASAVVGKLLAERTCLRSLTLLWVIAWLTTTPEAAVFGHFGNIAIVAFLLVAHYRWEYLARVTAFDWPKPIADHSEGQPAAAA
jgi:hypothetical protein